MNIRHFMSMLVLSIGVPQILSSELNVDTFGDILHIQTKCAKDVNGGSVITVTSAQDAMVTVVCRNNYIVRPKPADKVHYIQEVGFSPSAKYPCAFEKKTKSHVYTVELYVAKIDTDYDVALQETRHDFLVTCTYDETGSSVTAESEISFANVPFHQHIQELGGRLTSNITVLLENMGGKAATGPIPLGTSVRLYSNVTGSDYARIVTCSASNGIYNHTILSAGCGDGLIFPKNEGFTTVGKEILSPYFSSFRLRGNPTLVFKCKFASCGNQPCDGSSCSKTTKGKSSIRPKREADSKLDDTVYEVHSANVTIEGSKKEPIHIHVDATEQKSQKNDYSLA